MMNQLQNTPKAEPGVEMLVTQRPIWLQGFLAIVILVGSIFAARSGIPASGLLIIASAWLVCSVAALVLFRFRRTRLAGGLILAVTVASSFVISLYYQGMGVLAGLISAFFIATLAPLVFPRRRIPLAIGLNFLLVVVAYYFDSLIGIVRPRLMNSTALTVASMIVGAVFILLLFRRFNIYPLRTKLIMSFVMVILTSIVVVAVFSVNSTRSALSTSARLTLTTSAQHTAEKVDTFITKIQDTVALQTQWPAITDYLAASEPTVDMENALRSLMNTWQTRASVGVAELRPTFIQATILITLDGNVLFDTSQVLSGQNVSAQEYFRSVAFNAEPYVSPLRFSATGQPELYLSAPVFNTDEQLSGVLVVRYHGSVLQQLMLENAALAGANSYPLLLDEKNLRLGQGVAPEYIYRFITPLDLTLVASFKASNRLPNLPPENLSSDWIDLGRALQENSAGEETLFTFNGFGDNQQVNYLGSSAATRLVPWRVVYVQDEQYFFAPLNQQIRNTQLLAFLLTVVAAGIAVALSQVLTAPFIRMTQTTGAVTSGDLSIRIPVESQDEVGALATAFNIMTAQLQQTLSGLEQNVKQRTEDLELRSAHLQAAAEVGRAAATIHDTEDLLHRVTYLISEQFGFYHVGIFLVDDAGEYAVLRAANSEGGRKMLRRGHRLKVGQQGIVGYVTSTGQSRIALDVGEDAIFFNNPDLPLTRSEMALPLFAGSMILGALDVQSTKPLAFTEEDIVVMQVLADLLSSAIENARLFTESQNALEATRRAYGELSQLSWLERLQGNVSTGYRSFERGTVSLEAVGMQTEMSASSISVPVKVRDVVVGYVDVVKSPEQGSLSAEDQQTLNTLVDQLGIALESARLYEASQLQAERERLVGEITARMQESLDVDAVLATAAREVRRALGLKDVTIVLSENV